MRADAGVGSRRASLEILLTQVFRRLDWLRATLVLTRERPVALTEGVLPPCSGVSLAADEDAGA
jgi:hypothetical protein